MLRLTGALGTGSRVQVADNAVDVLERIGFGGCGEVYRCRYPDGTLAALKVFKPIEVRDERVEEKLRTRFVREVSVQRTLSSHRFMPVLHAALKSDPPFFTMPLAVETLEAYISRCRAEAQPLRVYAEPFAHVLDALQELHGLDFVHRDVKPSNILLHDGNWKISDLGFVRVPSARMTSTQSAYGTAPYMAPEQLLQFNEVTSAVDVYALGCILHDIAAKMPHTRLPYQQQSADAPLGWIIERCTEQDPEDRFRSVEALRGVLLDVLVQSAMRPFDETTGNWLADLSEVGQWDAAKLARFLLFLDRLDNKSDEHMAIMRRLDREAFDAIEAIDGGRFGSLFKYYCKWAGSASLEYSYCDVVADRLAYLFDASQNAGLAARAVIAMADMGVRHNRWYAWRRVLEMAGPNLSGNIARRIAMEIRAGEKQSQFEMCASRRLWGVESYHPTIAAELGPSDH